MKDVQNTKPFYPSPIDRVGIKDLKYPIRILRKDNTQMHTIADVYMCVSLPPDKKGTHMSRFVELFEKYKQDIDRHNIEKMLEEMIKRFEANHAYVQMTFPYFIPKRAPVSRKSSIMETNCGFTWSITKDEMKHEILVKVPVTTLCPCSKEISKYGAHNQRAYVSVSIQPKGDEWIWFEDLIDIIESCASAPLYPLLKRKDEKFVTEQAYENPRFVEDLIREILVKIKENFDKKVLNVKIQVESDESIHTHKAFAMLKEEINDEGGA